MGHNQKPLATIWKVSDELWSKLKPILDEFDPPNAIGRKRINPRAALNAIIFRLRTGCQWNQLPAEFPDDSSVHRTFQRWEQNGTLDQIWARCSNGARRALVARKLVLIQLTERNLVQKEVC